MLYQDAALDLAFQALADPSRRAIVERLSLGPATVTDLAKPLPMSLPAVMQHLAMLTNSGLVVTKKVGRARICRIEPGAMGELERWVQARRAEWERRLDRLGEYLDATDKGDTDGQ